MDSVFFQGGNVNICGHRFKARGWKVKGDMRYNLFYYRESTARVGVYEHLETYMNRQ